MVKILSRSGDSLADTYDVQGSIAGIDQLETRELPIVHEMGQTVFSERFSTTVRRLSTGAILQNIVFNIVVSNFPGTPTRLLGVAVISDNAARVDRLAVLARDPLNGREIPIWVADQATGTVPIEMDEDGAGVATRNIWRAHTDLLWGASFVGGNGQPQIVNEIAFRGATSGFGAGTVTLVALLYIAFGQIGGISSRGLPIPSW